MKDALTTLANGLIAENHRIWGEMKVRHKQNRIAKADWERAGDLIKNFLQLLCSYDKKFSCLSDHILNYLQDKKEEGETRFYVLPNIDIFVKKVMDLTETMKLFFGLHPDLFNEKPEDVESFFFDNSSRD